MENIIQISKNVRIEELPKEIKINIPFEMDGNKFVLEKAKSVLRKCKKKEFETDEPVDVKEIFIIKQI
ncbi:hypothetical protein NUSPORA_01314 [Nucleospora cyclopteri]